MEPLPKLTETQAWAYIAKRFSSRKRGGKLHIMVDVLPSGNPYQDNWAHGLCAAIAILSNNRIITSDVAWSMRDRLQRERPPYSVNRAYFWPLSRAGAKKRTAFCLRMAKATR